MYLNRRRFFMPTYSGGGVIPTPTVEALKFTLAQDSDSGTISLTIPSYVKAADYSYVEWSLDGQTWNRTDNTSSNVIVTTSTLNPGDSVYFRGVGSTLGDSSSSGHCSRFSHSSGMKILCEGDITHLLGTTTLGDYCFAHLFRTCAGLLTAPSLPSTTLSKYCYASMFEECTSLTAMPVIAATTLAQNCCDSMFKSCSSLVTTTALDASVMVSGCYYAMFQGCTSLVTAPALPSTSLADSCYGNMFKGCSSLTSVPVLNATALAPSCYIGMFQNCTGLVTAQASLPAMLLGNYCYEDMFNGCTALTSAPSLPATDLLQYCYNGMFKGCTHLTTAPDLPAITLINGCYYEMFKGCTRLQYVKALFTTDPSDLLTYDWLKNVKSSGTFVKNAAATWTEVSTKGVPSGWTIQTVSV